VTDLYWFRQDLRLDDNPALTAHAQGDALVCVYCMTPPVAWCNVSGTGAHRTRFLRESLYALQRDLRERGQDLLVLHGAPEKTLPALVAECGIKRIGVAATPGTFERRTLARLSSRAGVPVEVHDGNTLFSSEQIASAMPRLAGHYTPFRQAVESLAANAPVPPAALLPPPPSRVRFTPLPSPGFRANPAFAAQGGSAAARRRLQGWMFREDRAGSYSDTRNQLEGLYFSSQLSPWLADGSLSVRRVAAQLRLYEQQQGRNRSTAAFFRELLWREFFHWRAYQDGHLLFRATGLMGRKHLRTFDPRAFARWCAGETDYPLVNALMHQLVATGWMSNRGRQIVASCLVNELGQDWRFGAAFFEKHLIDHDVACNYGNWQYIAGVGTDPRGGRWFNQAKQALHYDPEGEFTARWDGYRPPQREFVVDAADWPIADAAFTGPPGGRCPAC
jgi:deoxyribodipyrimidine photo-lyase